MTRYETRTGHRHQLLAVSLVVAFLVSACGGGDADGGGTGITPAVVAQLDATSTSIGTTAHPALSPRPLTNAPPPASCSYSPWVQGTIYEADSIVSYSGSLYVARISNAGSVPTPNQHGWSDWSAYDCGAPAPAPAPQTCPAAPWVQGTIYEAGSNVSYSGSLYIARIWNAGSLPTPNANGRSDWAPYDCSTPAPALVVQPASRVNTTTAGEQRFASVSAQTNGGYTVAWIDNDMAFAIQRYDSAGGKVGTEVSVPFSRLATTGVINKTSVAVLRDGSVVFVYETSRRLGTGQAVEGVFFQRFDSSGVQLSGETTVVSQIAFGGPVVSGAGNPRAVPLADGGFVVAWASYSVTPISVFNTVFKQRYDSQAQAVGGNVFVSVYRAVGLGAYALNADREGGYTFTLFRSNNPSLNAPATSVIHFGAAGTAREIVAERLGSSLLLPLASDRFVLFTSDSAGTFRQFLDSAGNPVGPATSVASMPSAATELADGSFVVFSQASGGGITAQRFAASGAALGDAVPVDAIVSAQGVAALNGGGLALGWSATPPGGDLDVFTERVLVRN